MHDTLFLLLENGDIEVAHDLCEQEDLFRPCDDYAIWLYTSSRTWCFRYAPFVAWTRSGRDADSLTNHRPFFPRTFIRWME